MREDYDSAEENLTLLAKSEQQSSRNQIQDDLLADNALLKAIYDGMVDTIFVKNITGHYLLMNEVGAAVLDKPAEDIIGKNDQELFHPEIARQIIEHDLQVFTTRKAVTLEEIIQNEKGQRVFLTTKSPWLDKEGNLVGLVGIAREISERKRIEQALKDSESRYRSLFENSPIGFWEEDHSEVKSYVDELRKKGITDFDTYFCENPAELRHCASLVKILGHNRQAEKGLENLTDKSLKKGLLDILRTDQSWQRYHDELTTFSEGKTRFEGEDTDVNPNTGETTYYIVNATIASGDQQDWSRVYLSLIDITSLHRVEQARRESEGRLRSILKVAPVGIGVVTNRILLEINDRVCEMVGRKQEELRGQSALILYPSIAEFKRVGNEKYSQIEQRGTGTIETKWVHKNGQIIDVLLSSTPIDPARLSLGVTFTAMDITERKKAEEALRSSEMRYRSLFENLPIAVNEEDLSAVKIFLDSLSSSGITDLRSYLKESRQALIYCASLIKVIKGNQAAIDLFLEEPLREWQDFSASFDDETLNTFADELADFYEGKTNFMSEGFHRKSSGETFRSLFHITILPGHENDWARAIISIQDITARKRMEEALRESELRYRRLFEDSPIGLYEEDFSKVKLYFNMLEERGISNLKAYLEENPQEVQHCLELVRIVSFNQAAKNNIERIGIQNIPQSVSDIASEQTMVYFREELLNFAAGKSPFSAEFSNTANNGNPIHWLVRISFAPGYEDNWGRVIVSSMDITGRKLAEERLQTALVEKEVLLRELYHRVKNNLQMLISLIALQAQHLDDDHSRLMFSELQDRVRVIALIHEQLCQANNLAKIDMGIYLKSLAINLSQVFALRHDISLLVNANEVTFSLETAMPLGMIVNELVSNSFKYAFPPDLNKSDCAISIDLHDKTDHYLLEVSDNGIGLPQDLDWSTSETLGLQLVHILASHQMGGKVVVNREKGTKYLIEFPKNHESE